VTYKSGYNGNLCLEHSGVPHSFPGSLAFPERRRLTTCYDSSASRRMQYVLPDLLEIILEVHRSSTTG